MNFQNVPKWFWLHLLYFITFIIFTIILLSLLRTRCFLFVLADAHIHTLEVNSIVIWVQWKNSSSYTDPPICHFIAWLTCMSNVLTILQGSHRESKMKLPNFPLLCPIDNYQMSLISKPWWPAKCTSTCQVHPKIVFETNLWQAIEHWSDNW